MNDDMPVVTLTSGLRVGNFSSPHPFTFTDGTILPGCSETRARTLMLRAEEIEMKHAYPSGATTTDMLLTFVLTPVVVGALFKACTNGSGLPREDVDIVLTPLPVAEALERGVVHTPDGLVDAALQVAHPIEYDCCRQVVRVCRVADRVTKVIHADRFCL